MAFSLRNNLLGAACFFGSTLAASAQKTTIDYTKLHSSDGMAYQQKINAALQGELPDILGSDFDDLEKAGFRDMNTHLVKRGENQPADLMIDGYKSDTVYLGPGLKHIQTAYFRYTIADDGDGIFNQKDLVTRQNKFVAEVVPFIGFPTRILSVCTETTNQGAASVFSELREQDNKGRMKTTLGDNDLVKSDASPNEINALFNEFANLIGTGTFADDSIVTDPRLKKTKKTVDLTPGNSGK